MFPDLKRIYENIGEKADFTHIIPAEAIPSYNGRSFPQGAEISGCVFNRAGVVTLRWKIGLRLETPCDRCLRPIDRRFGFESEHILVRSLSNTDNDDYVVTEGDAADLEELAVSDILLGLPARLLCDDGCKGLCPVCGADLNEGECGCGDISRS